MVYGSVRRDLIGVVIGTHAPAHVSRIVIKASLPSQHVLASDHHSSVFSYWRS